MADTQRKSESQDVNYLISGIVKGYHHCRFEVNAGELDNVSGRWIQNGVTVQGEKENLTSCVHVLHKNFNLVISRYSCAWNDKEMCQQV